MVGDNIGQYRTIEGKKYRRIDHNLTKDEAIYVKNEYRRSHPNKSIRLINVDGRYFVYVVE